MGIFDFLSDLTSAFTSEVDAEAPTRGGSTYDSPASGTDEESEEEKEVNVQDAKKVDESEKPAGHRPGHKEGGDEEEEDKPEEEEEEEEEPEDIKPKLEEGKAELTPIQERSRLMLLKLIAYKECMQSKQCAPLKHHYDKCAERVTQQIDEKGKADEDCVEEYFHLMHCATQCAAPKLFQQLK